MFGRLRIWFKTRFSREEPPPPVARSGAHVSPRPRVRPQHQPQPARQSRPQRQMPARGQPEPSNLDTQPRLDGQIESNGPGKNVLIRNRYVREETGTHETLKILDDSAVESGEESGIDPYNTGGFDRSRHWDKRFRK